MGSPLAVRESCLAFTLSRNWSKSSSSLFSVASLCTCMKCMQEHVCVVVTWLGYIGIRWKNVSLCIKCSLFPRPHHSFCCLHSTGAEVWKQGYTTHELVGKVMNTRTAGADILHHGHARGSPSSLNFPIWEPGREAGGGRSQDIRLSTMFRGHRQTLWWHNHKYFCDDITISISSVLQK